MRQKVLQEEKKMQTIKGPQVGKQLTVDWFKSNLFRHTFIPKVWTCNSFEVNFSHGVEQKRR